VSGNHVEHVEMTPTRQRIITLLDAGVTRSETQLVDQLWPSPRGHSMLGARLGNLNRAIRPLVAAGIVVEERRGAWSYYRAANGSAVAHP